MDFAYFKKLATSYTAAWCSQNPEHVAAHYSEEGSLTINGGDLSVGRAAIAEAARGFMTAFPDMVVTMDGISLDGDTAVYRWTLTGKNTGLGGSGNTVHISGHEKWKFGTDGLIDESRGVFDDDDYQRQLGSRK